MRSIYLKVKPVLLFQLYREKDVFSCQQQMDTFKLHVESLKKWADEMTERIPTTQPSLNPENLKKDLQNTKVR